MRNVIEMAREVKMPYDFVTGEPLYLEKLEAFASLVRADEHYQSQMAAPQVRATHKVVADLTEKNLEATLLNLTKTDKPITIKPTTWFGNPAKTAQWYKCPNCAKQSPLTLEWVGLTDDEIKEIIGPHGDMPIKGYTRKLFDQIEAALRSKNT